MKRSSESIDIKNTFYSIYKTKYRNYIQTVINNWAVQPIMDTIDNGMNKFRCGLSYLISKRTDTTENAIIIGSAAEIIWGAILILDDLGDNAYIRRGKPSVWIDKGILHASHLLPLGQLISEEILSIQFGYSEIYNSFRRALKDTIDSQIEQAYFHFQTLNDDIFRNNYIKKTSIGRWALTASSYLDNKSSSIIDETYEELAFAAQIKNDVDDFLIDNNYEHAFEDLKNRIITYPIYILFNKCTSEEKEKIKGYYEKKNEYSYTDILDLVYKYNIIKICISIINEEVERVVKKLPEEFVNKYYEYYLWVLSHKYQRYAQ